MHIPCAKYTREPPCWIGTACATSWKWRARSEVSAAARKLGVEHTTVARRVRALEAELDSLLFEKSRSAGYVLTEDGQRLFVFAEQMESTVHTARENLSGIGQALSGHVRIGATEDSAAMC